MIDPGLLLFLIFLVLLLAGAPIAIALGASGAFIMVSEGLGASAIATNAYTSISKYPLLALPLFILTGMIFERAGVAARMVKFLSLLVGQWHGSKALVAILVCLLLGGISGSGVADAAAVAAVMLPAMTRAGYPRAFSASLIAAGGTTAILIPPSVGFILYSILVPQASVPAMLPPASCPACSPALALIVPAALLPSPALPLGPRRTAGQARRRRWPLEKPARGDLGPRCPADRARRPAWHVHADQAAVVAVFYGMFVGMVIYRSMGWRELSGCRSVLRPRSRPVVIIMALASNFITPAPVLGALDKLSFS
ncbi:MAG: TRAP transporter large permease subunit [Burkholderiaceae bacterium]